MLRAVRSHSTACDDETFMFPKECRRLPLRGGGVLTIPAGSFNELPPPSGTPSSQEGEY